MQRKPICPDTLKRLYASGETLKQIAKRFDCDKKTIHRRSKELGLRHPSSPQQRRREMDTTLHQLETIERYKKGESLMALAKSESTCIDVVRRYLERNGVHIRTRVEQTAETIKIHGTRFHKTESRLYVCKRDSYGLVTEVKVYLNKSRKSVKIWGQWGLV